jgi:hypothetical protein
MTIQNTTINIQLNCSSLESLAESRLHALALIEAEVETAKLRLKAYDPMEICEANETLEKQEIDTQAIGSSQYGQEAQDESLPTTFKEGDYGRLLTNRVKLLVFWDFEISEESLRANIINLPTKSPHWKGRNGILTKAKDALKNTRRRMFASKFMTDLVSV